MHIRRHRSSIDWSDRGGNLLRLDCVEEAVTAPTHPSAGRSSEGCRSQLTPRSLCSQAVLAMAILCIAASGGCTSTPAPKRASVTIPTTTTSPASTPTWTELYPPISPPARGDASMAYDPATRTMLLFGGQSDRYPSYLDDTWSWNGTAWIKLFPSTSPLARSDAPMAYDAATRTVLLFNGGCCNPGLGQTWRWNGTTWTKLSPATSPAARYGASMAYDPGTQAMLLFGDGYDREFNDTWTLRDPSPPPASTR